MLKLVKQPDLSMIFEQISMKTVHKKKEPVYQNRKKLSVIEYFFL